MQVLQPKQRQIRLQIFHFLAQLSKILWIF